MHFGVDFLEKLTSSLSHEWLQCVEGHPFLSRCPSSLYFDDIQKLCTFKNEAVCGPVPTSKKISITYIWLQNCVIFLPKKKTEIKVKEKTFKCRIKIHRISSAAICEWLGISYKSTNPVFSFDYMKEIKLVITVFDSQTATNHTSIQNCLSWNKLFEILFPQTAPAPVIVEEIDRARKCDPANCQLPNCFCSSDG